MHVRHKCVQPNSGRCDSVVHAGGQVEAYATHVQRDKIENTRDAARKAALREIVRDVLIVAQPTSSFVLGVSRLDEARLGGDRIVTTRSGVYGASAYRQANYTPNDNLFAPIKLALDELNNQKLNNVQDALIAETAIKEGHVLITDDRDLQAVTTQFGGRCSSVAGLMAELASS